MASMQGKGFDSTEISGEETDSDETSQHDACDFCPFGGSSRCLGDLLNYEAVKESAERGHCQACAGIVKFIYARKLEPIELTYHDKEFVGRTVDLSFASGIYPPTYEFFVKKEEPAGDEISTSPDHYLDYGMIPRLHAPSGDTSSKAAFDTLKRWISRCEAEHMRCQPVADKRLPHRVLEIESSEPLRIRLVENCTRLEKYACLSHRWGPQTKMNSLNKQNLDLYRTRIPQDKLYPLVTDAIAATIRLDIRFIWIDSYCIIQDDINDWEAEAANMALIYENAFLTISATFSEGGCSMFSTISREFEALQVTEMEGEPVYIRKQLPHPCEVDHRGNEYLYGPSLERAWVFQERLLSNRFVHFTSSEIFWECRESTWCECDSRRDEWIKERERRPRTLVGQDWRLIVLQYNDTQLSFEKDRLPALAGVARRYAELTGGGTYLAGLWKEDLPEALAWHKNCAEPRPVEQFVPTWSWASLPRGRRLTEVPPTRHRWSKPSVRCEIKPTEADVYMGAELTEITVEGPMLDLTVYKESSRILIGKHENTFLQIRADFETDPIDDTTFRAVPNGSRCLLLLLFDHDQANALDDVFGIVLLQHNSSADLEVPKFERIGHFGNYRFSHVDEFNEYTEYCGGRFETWANIESCFFQSNSTTLEWLLDKSKTRRVTLV